MTTVETANAAGLSTNANFKRIVDSLRLIGQRSEAHDQHVIFDAITLLQQQNAEIHAAHDAKRCYATRT